MINLIEYGFEQTGKTDNYTEFSGYGFRITIFDYEFMQSDKIFSRRQTFVVDTKQTTKPYLLDELGEWLNNHKIEKR